jgi:hypothetical protein
VLHIGLNLRVGELATDQALGVEDCVDRVHSDLVLRSVTNKALCVGEGNERGCCAVTLVVGNDFNAVISEDAYAGVGCTEINT